MWWNCNGGRHIHGKLWENTQKPNLIFGQALDSGYTPVDNIELDQWCGSQPNPNLRWHSMTAWPPLYQHSLRASRDFPQSKRIFFSFTASTPGTCNIFQGVGRILTLDPNRGHLINWIRCAKLFCCTTVAKFTLRQSLAATICRVKL